MFKAISSQTVQYNTRAQATEWSTARALNVINKQGADS